MPSPAYTSTKSPVKNLAALLTYLSVTFNPTSTVYQLLAAAVHKLALLIEVPIASIQLLSGAGAVDLVTQTTKLTTTGANALTLANGTNGQIKNIVMAVDGGDGVLTPTTKTGFTTITFSAIGQSATLQYFTTQGWVILSLNGAVAA